MTEPRGEAPELMLPGADDAAADAPAPLGPRLALASQILGGLVAVAGLLVLAGWALDVPFLKAPHARFISMKANAAAGLVLLGAALALGRTPGRRLALWLLGAPVALLGAATLAQYALDVDLGFDQLLFREAPGTPLTIYPGRLSFTAGLCFLLLGAGALPVFRSRWAARLRPWLGAAAFSLALLALVGYGYGASLLYDLAYGTPLAPHTAGAFLLAAASLILASTGGGFAAVLAAPGAGGALARRWLPLVLVMPFTELVGWAAEGGTPYDQARGDALHAVALSAVFAGLLLFTSGRLERSDRARRRAFEALRESEVALARKLGEEQEAARAANAYQAMLFDNLHDAVIGIDARMAVTAWNRAAERTLGWSREEVLGRPVSSFMASQYDDGESFAAKVAQVAQTGATRVTVRRRTRGGEWLDIESNSVALRDAHGNVTGYVSVSRDVTARKRAEAALRASQERLARILEASGEGIWVVDASGRTEFANARAAEMVGAPEREIVGRFFFDVLPAELRGRARATLRRVLRGESVAGELALRRPDGSEIWVEISARPLRDAEGRVEGGISVFMDVTARRAAQAQLLQSQKMEAVGRLASGIAHDFNNLLAVVLSNAGSLEAELPQGDPLREDAEAIRQAGERAAGLVKQLLAFGRRSSGRPVTTDPGAVVRGIQALLRRAAGEGVALSLSLAGDGWGARVDPGQLEQVLMNLAVNARDAMAGRGELHIETGSQELRNPPPACPTLRPGRYAVVSVADTGCGMTPGVVSRIFEPFFTTKPRGEGTGLGLSTVYGIVEGAGGKIAVESQPGRGTTFTVYLPALCPEGPETSRRSGNPSENRVTPPA